MKTSGGCVHPRSHVGSKEIGVYMVEGSVLWHMKLSYRIPGGVDDSLGKKAVYITSKKPCR